MGASWVQENILEKNPGAELRVYAIWFSMLSNDARSRWPDRIMTDPRVIHLWDKERLTGRFFSKEVGFTSLPIAWDIYYLYGPDVNWDTNPTPIVSSGSYIISKGRQLQDALLPLLEG